MKRDREVQREGETAIYIHIPFCVSKCAYCDFLSFPAGTPAGSLKMMDDYFGALSEEIGATPHRGRRVSSIYLGGGTPSLPEPSYISGIMDCVRDAFAVGEDAEVSMEANPGTLKKDALTTYLDSGINRLSIGVQSFDDSELAVLGRIHSAAEAEESFRMARDAGFTDLNIDLIAAVPGQNRNSLLRSVRRAVSLGPEHISLYSLIVEPGTPFYERYADQVPDPHYDRPVRASGEGGLPGEDEEREMLHAAWEELEDAGYDRYEISNFARISSGDPGRYRCRQNVTYWKRGEYLGFGPGAASLMNRTRSSNVRDLREYIKRISASGRAVDEGTVQDLGTEDEEAEFMFLGLRMREGVSEQEFSAVFGHDIDEVYGDELAKLAADGLLERRDKRVFLTALGTDLANTVMAEFI